MCCYDTRKHVWTNRTFQVNSSGLYLDDNVPDHRLPCPVGKPGVFMRTIRESEVREAIVNLMKGSTVYEDWYYWFDMDFKPQKGFSPYERDLLIEKTIEKVLSKYEKLNHSMDSFREFINSV